MGLRNIHRLIRQGDLKTHSVSLGGVLHGFVYKSKKGKLHMFIDESLSPNATECTLLHESGHIIDHINKPTCIIGIDDMHSPLEKEANRFMEEYQGTLLKEAN